ncbi:type IV pilus modification protein PilV [Janthinobacterium aquaticum]|uniref:type IV pilus modification protein PilV n=1 Tax=Janthinobacterium sp. FT58W TaxID=2654254 RepID=UPI001D02FF56|nr:type IV pilus modification protein PilV [Janthinobacterium sp. FT58W]
MDGMRCSISLSTGSSLVEVLVALVLLTLGLLGASTLHVATLRAQHESTLASRAAQLAAGMAERLRANRAVMTASDVDNPYLGLDHDAGDNAPLTGGGSTGSACFGSASCSAAQLAQFDIDEWREQLHTALPGGRLRICRDLPAGDTADDEAGWACSGAAHAPVVIKLGWRERYRADLAGGMGGPKLVWQVAGGAP